jgi:hypothetical protein
MRQKPRKELEEKYGESLRDVLAEMYSIKMMPTRSIARTLGYADKHAKVISFFLKKYDIPIRHGGEAVRTQWIDAGMRRKNAAELMKEIVNSRPHFAIGLTKETHPGIARTAQKLKERQWMNTPEIKARAKESRRVSIENDPMMHGQSKAKMTPCEMIVADIFKQRGYKVIGQHPVQINGALHFADLYVPDFNLLIEVAKTTVRVPLFRVRNFVQAGYLPAAITNNVALKHHDRIHDLIARLEAGEFNPTSLRECWMVTRSASFSAITLRDFDEPIR